MLENDVFSAPTYRPQLAVQRRTPQMLHGSRRFKIPVNGMRTEHWLCQDLQKEPRVRPLRQIPAGRQERSRTNALQRMFLGKSSGQLL